MNGVVKPGDGNHWVMFPERGKNLGKCCILEKSLYRMRPAPRAWEWDCEDRCGRGISDTSSCAW